MSQIRLGVIMDPIAGITPAKDSTLAMLLAAQSRDWDLYYFEQKHLRLVNGEAIGTGARVHVQDDSQLWFELEPPEDLPLAQLDLVLMRKDPPFDMEYIYTTYILERAQEHGVLVVNEPAALRDINEKAFTAWFPQCCPDTVITRSIPDMRSFLKDHGEIVVKPLHGMGGRSIFVVRRGDNNANVIFETLTEDGTAFAIAQRYIPEITEGDKRILIVDGEPAGVSLARITPPDDNRGNLVMGAQPEVRELSDRDLWICNQVAPMLRERGVLFA